MKKFIALLLAVLMVASMFAGCGAKDTAEAPAAEGEAAPAAIKLGMCGPLTGGAAVYGTAVQAGMQIAVEEINALGGIQFELNYQDDAHDAEKSVNAYNTLKDWGMQIFLGSVTSAPGEGTKVVMIKSFRCLPEDAIDLQTYNSGTTGRLRQP